MGLKLNDYVAELQKYELVLNVTIEISLNQHGIDTTGRGVRAVKLFTRQILTALSLSKILPTLSDRDDPDDHMWDVGSIASLTRNMVETFLAIFYSGTERVCSEEVELRFLLTQRHRNQEWYYIRKLTNPNDPELPTFESGLAKQGDKIRAHPHLSKLTNAQKNRALKFHEIYYTKADFEQRLPVCAGLSRDTALLSNFVHPLPLSTERIDNDRGRGTFNQLDLTHIIMATIIARSYLAASTVAICDFFLDTLGTQFRSQIDAIRNLQFRTN